MNIIRFISIQINKVLAKDDGHTICYSVYKRQKSSNFYRFWYFLINLCFFWEHDHCRKIFLVERGKVKF